jgi:hypothetical protein
MMELHASYTMKPKQGTPKVNKGIIMWKTIIIPFLALSLFPFSSHASRERHSNTEALVGGLIAGAILADIHSSNGPSVEVRLDARHRHPDNAWESYQKPRYRGRDDYRRDSGYRDERGYFEYRQERVWVPGYWETNRSPCGRRSKVWVEGYWDFRSVKVWVPAGRSSRYDSCRP